MIGIQYVTWFGLEGVGSGCQGSGWRDKPFNLEGVQSLAFGASPNGFCYSSWDPNTALVHAGLLDELNVDFLILDDTNLSKAMLAKDNPIHQCNLKVLEGLRGYRKRRIRAVMMQSITNWNAAQEEIFTFNEYVQSHIDSIARQHLAFPDDFLRVNGKPVLLFYISQGSNVHLNDGSPAFHGAGNIAPMAADFDCVVNVAGKPSLRDFFTVRYAVVADSVFDYRPYSTELWPFQCNYGRAMFTEAAYASLYAGRLQGGRSIQLFNSLVDEGRDKSFLIIRVWNEFSSTDEHGGYAYTIEPNTQLHKVDSTPGNADPWYYFNKIKTRLSRKVLINRESGRVLDVELPNVRNNGATIQQWGQTGGKNQQWVTIAQSFTNIQSEKVLDVDLAKVHQNGARVQQWTNNSTPNQQWTVVDADSGWVWLRNEMSGKALDVQRDKIHEDGAPIQQWDYAATPNQQWKIVTLPL